MALQQRCVDGIINGLFCPVGPSTPANAQQSCAAVAHDLHTHSYSGNPKQRHAQLLAQQCRFAWLRGIFQKPVKLCCDKA